MLLSILICTLPDRAEGLEKLKKRIEACFDGKDFEIVIDSRDRSVPTGNKRNCLIDKACGEYCVFIDDDDDISDDYGSLIIEALESKPAVVGIQGIIHFIPPFRGVSSGLFIHSIEYLDWYSGFDGTYYRTPNHLNPVLTEIARDVRFNNFKWIGEDHDYSKRITKVLKGRKEVMIKTPIYHYFYDTTKEQEGLTQ